MRNGMKIIDAHCHIYPEKIVDRAVAGTDHFYGTTAACRGTVEELFAVGDKAGIDGFLVHSVATAPKQVQSINTFIAACVAEGDGRLIGFGTIHPDSTDPEGDLEHLVSLGLRGVKIHPDIQGFDLDDPRYLRHFAWCEAHGIPVLAHTGDKRYDHSNPNRLIPVLKQFPDLRVIGAHFGGWSIWKEASGQLAGIPNLWVDCSSSLPYLTPTEAAEIIRRYGSDRVFFGSDYPMWSPEVELDSFLSVPLTPEEQRKILSQNLLDFLG